MAHTREELLAEVERVSNMRELRSCALNLATNEQFIAMLYTLPPGYIDLIVRYLGIDSHLQRSARWLAEKRNIPENIVYATVWKAWTLSVARLRSDMTEHILNPDDKRKLNPSLASIMAELTVLGHNTGRSHVASRACNLLKQAFGTDGASWDQQCCDVLCNCTEGELLQKLGTHATIRKKTMALLNEALAPFGRRLGDSVGHEAESGSIADSLLTAGSADA